VISFKTAIEEVTKGALFLKFPIAHITNKTIIIIKNINKTI
jgi:hypothetical protein